MSRRKFVNPLRFKKTRVARPDWMDGLEAHSNGSESNGTSRPDPSYLADSTGLADAINHVEPGQETPVRRQPWLSTRKVFESDEQFQQFMSILEENRRELFPPEDLEE